MEVKLKVSVRRLKGEVMVQQLTLALSKGRIFEETLPLLEAAGIRVTEDPEKSRKLILATNDRRYV
jgi:ATP phosphoribosyltransferase